MRRLLLATGFVVAVGVLGSCGSAGAPALRRDGSDGRSSSLAVSSRGAISTPAAAPVGASATLSVQLSWPSVVSATVTATLDCGASSPAPGSAAGALCRTLAETDRGGVLPAAKVGCVVAPLEERSAQITGRIDGARVDVILTGCDEPAIGQWFAIGGYQSPATRPRSRWCPGAAIDPGTAPLVLAPIVQPPTPPAIHGAAADAVAQTMVGMRGGLIGRARLLPAGRLRRYTPDDHLLEFDTVTVPSAGAVSGSIAGDARQSLAARSDWQQQLVRGALRDRLCAAAGGPVVGTATRTGRRLVRRRDPIGGDVAYGQVFDAEPAATIRTRILAQLAAAGLVPIAVDVFEPLDAAPLIIAEAPDPAAFATHVDAVMSRLAGEHPDFDLYEGVYVEIRDPAGSILATSARAARTGEGGSRRRPDIPNWEGDAAFQPVFYVPPNTREFQALPDRIRLPHSRAELVDIRWTNPSTDRLAMTATARLSRCPGCRSRPVSLAAPISSAGCDARAISAVVIRDPRTGRRSTAAIGATPGCLVAPT